MEKVGQSKIRNQKYFEKFDRGTVIKNVINKKDPICFDIGAHIGESVVYFNKLFNNPLIYSFEPSPNSFEILKKNNYKNNLCFNYAISNMTGNTVFYENEISHTNSLVKINPLSVDSIKKQKTVNSKINVKAIKLDDFIIEQKIKKIDVLKIDVQGAEALVLEGGDNALKLSKIVIVEICFFDYYKNKGGFFDIEKFLKPNSFSLFSISEISYNPMNGRTDWVEAIYKKDI